MILGHANAKGMRRVGGKITFAALHNCAKHIIHIAEALESCIMVITAMKSNLEGDMSPPMNQRSALVRRQLQERLDYRKSLFRSTQLRLSSLQKRIDNVITLSFNLVTQQDSMVMIQDSNSMKIIAAITMMFLPTTGVASVIGSQLLVTDLSASSGTWNVSATPLFWIMWWVAIPLTVFVVILAIVWHWWTHSENATKKMVGVVRRATTLGLSPKTTTK